jgi:hypothetical protein
MLPSLGWWTSRGGASGRSSRPIRRSVPQGALVFFAQYLAATGAFDALVADPPLCYGSNRAHSPRDVLGTLLLGILAGHYRYAHLAALRGDDIAPRLLGLEAIAQRQTAFDTEGRTTVDTPPRIGNAATRRTPSTSSRTSGAGLALPPTICAPASTPRAWPGWPTTGGPFPPLAPARSTPRGRYYAPPFPRRIRPPDRPRRPTGARCAP